MADALPPLSTCLLSLHDDMKIVRKKTFINGHGTNNLKKSQVLGVYISGRNVNVDFPHEVACGVSDLIMCSGTRVRMLEDL